MLPRHAACGRGGAGAHLATAHPTHCVAPNLCAAGAASEAVVGSLDSDTSGMEGALSAASACGSAPTGASGPHRLIVGSAPSSSSSAAPRKAQVRSAVEGRALTHLVGQQCGGMGRAHRGLRTL